ncbi:MAG: CDP-alcohol phosphatidyltransferase family protein [Syntrophobacteraceae bacterium]
MPLQGWETKPTDRFVLRWIKVNCSARITPHLLALPWLQPWMITLGSASLGALAGLVFACGWGWGAGLLAACSQVFDGVDGQLARIAGRQSRGGAFWDSVLDRYADGAMVIGLVLYLVRPPAILPLAPTLVLGAFALIGSNLISYSSARAEGLGIDLGPPTLASKGTRSTIMILGALGSACHVALPFMSLLLIVFISNGVVVSRLMKAHRCTDPL